MNAVAITSLVGTGVFAVAGVYLLYLAWSFMSSIDGHRRSRKDSNSELRDLYTNIHEDSTGSSRKKGKHGKKKLKKLKHSKRQKRKDELTFRSFHYHILSYVFGITSMAFSIFYLLQWTGVLQIARISDGVLINPFRWLVLAPIASGVSGLLASMFVNHYIMDLLLVQTFGNAGRFILGVAMFLAVGSVPFWVLFAVSCALMIIAFIFLWGRHTLRSSRAIALLFYAIIGAAYTITYLASPEEFAWLSNLGTTIAYLVLDVLIIIGPAFVVMSDWYFRKYGIPVLPLMIYEAYGLGHWWKMHTNKELHYLWPFSLLMVTPKVLGKHHHHHGDDDDELFMLSHCNICGQKQTSKDSASMTTQEGAVADSSKKTRKSSRDDVESDESSSGSSSDSNDSGSESEGDDSGSTGAFPTEKATA